MDLYPESDAFPKTEFIFFILDTSQSKWVNSIKKQGVCLCIIILFGNFGFFCLCFKSLFYITEKVAHEKSKRSLCSSSMQTANYVDEFFIRKKREMDNEIEHEQLRKSLSSLDHPDPVFRKEVTFNTTVKLTMCYIVCLFGGFRSTREFFTHMKTSPLPVRESKILTYTRHKWPLSSEGSLAYHTYCDTRHLFTMVINYSKMEHCYFFGHAVIGLKLLRISDQSAFKIDNIYIVKWYW